MLNGVGTNISMAYTSNYNKKSTGDKMNIITILWISA